MTDQPSRFSEPSESSNTGLALASLVLGILAVVLSLFLIGSLFGLVGIILGAIYLSRKLPPRGMAWWGVSLSVAGIIASIALGVLYYAGYQKIKEYLADTASDSDSLSSWEGVLAPDFTVTTLEGETIQLSDLKGKRVVVDFWATWCGPCVKEIPHFIQIVNESSRDELVILGISEEDADTLKPFVKKHGINYPIASASDLPPPYSDVTSIPTTFFIDRNGVIQTVLSGYHDLDSLREEALADDYEGEPKEAPEEGGVIDLPERSPQLEPVAVWSKTGIAGKALCAGDWDSDGAPDILVSAGGKKLLVLGIDGAEKGFISLPKEFEIIECGRHKTGGFRLLGYSVWGKEVVAMDRAGKQLWAYSSTLGVDGAHWGDLDGDGSDEMVVGMNGSGGLHAVSPEGKKLWQAKLGNVWNQAVVPAQANSPALVFATEAGGSVRVFDAKGGAVRTFRPHGNYFSRMTAARLNGSIQGIATHESTVAFDERGKVLWTTPSRVDHGAWRRPSFAVGDVDGDGAADWAFQDPSGQIVLVSAGGEKIGTLTKSQREDGFILVPDQSARAMLVVLNASTLRAYRFE